MTEHEKAQEKWAGYTEARDRAETLRYELFTDEIQNLPKVLREALCEPRQRRYALEMISLLQPEMQRGFLSDLVELASFSGRDIFRAREIILSFPKTWLIANLNSAVAPILLHAGDEEYRRIIELYLLIDPMLAQNLAQAAATHENEEVRAVGRDFLNQK
jgi:hypothetical protein